MRWMLMGRFSHGMAHGFAAFMLFRLFHRLILMLVIIGLIILVIHFWSRSQDRRGW